MQIPDWLKDEVAGYDIPLLDPPKTVLDIGSNMGAFTERAAKMWPDCTIKAYDPLPQSRISFEEKFPKDRVSFKQKAVRSFSGPAEIFEGKIEQTSGFHQLLEQTDRKIPVECLDAAELESAEFVKIDTEGCELEILNRLSLEKTRAIALEYHSHADEHEIIKFCQDRDFMLVEKRLGWLNRGILKFVRKGEKLIIPKTKLFIGIPIYGGIDPHFFCSALKLMAEYPVDCYIKPIIGDSLISRARNSLTMDFLKSDCTHMLQIDSDLIFSCDQIKRILSHDLDVVGGFYPLKKEGNPELVCNALDPQPVMDPVTKLTEVKYIGTGFICVSRRVFSRMIEAYSDKIAYVSDHDGITVEYDFWPVGPYKFPNGFVRYLSEDWYFCQRARDLGFKIYGDNGVTLRHSGNAVYPLSYQEPLLFSRVPANASSDSVPPVSLSPAQPEAALT